jgi:hypothetical protein
MVRTLSPLVTAVLVAAACSAEKNAGSAGDTVTSAQPAPSPAADSQVAAAPSDSASAWTVTPSGLGPIRVGMSAADLRRVGGDIKLPASSAECAYVKPALAPPGVSVMLARGEVARVDVDSAGVLTDAGVAVGDSTWRVSQAYVGRVTVTPHKYVQGGQYLTVKPGAPQDSLRIVFESEGGRITRYRVGRIPQVEWVERCG